LTLKHEENVKDFQYLKVKLHKSWPIENVRPTPPAIKKWDMGFIEQVSVRSVPGRSGLAWGTYWGCFGFFLMCAKKLASWKFIFDFPFFPF
jgi:hypothetical protein